MSPRSIAPKPSQITLPSEENLSARDEASIIININHSRTHTLNENKEKSLAYMLWDYFYFLFLFLSVRSIV